MKSTAANKFIQALRKIGIGLQQPANIKFVNKKQGKETIFALDSNGKATVPLQEGRIKNAIMIAAVCTMIGGTISCRKPIEAEPEVQLSKRSSNGVDTAFQIKNPKDYPIDTTKGKSPAPKDTIYDTKSDTLKHNMYGDWLCTSLCRANPTFEKDKLHITKDSLTWYTWGRTVASHGDALGYNSVTYYNINMLPNIDQNDEKKVSLFKYDSTANKIFFYVRVQGGEIIPNKGYIPELNRESLYCKFDTQAQLLFLGNLQYKPIK